MSKCATCTSSNPVHNTKQMQKNSSVPHHSLVWAFASNQWNWWRETWTCSMEENISNILLLFSFLMTSLSARNAFITSFSMSRVVPSKPFVVCSCDRRDYSLNHGSLVLKVFFYPLPCDFYLLGLTMLLVLVLIYSPNKCIKHQLIFNLTSMISLQALLAVGY